MSLIVLKNCLDNIYLEETVYEDKSKLASHGSPFQNVEKNYLEFSLNGFEDFLERKRAFKNRTD